MIFPIGVNRDELWKLLSETDVGVGLYENEIDCEVGMEFPQELERATWSVAIKGSPDQIRRAIEKIDPNHNASHGPGWFK